MPFEVRTRHERLTRMCFIDYDRQMALIAQNLDQIIGVGRLIKLPFTQEAEVAAIVTDDFQHKGVGKWGRVIAVRESELIIFRKVA